MGLIKLCLVESDNTAYIKLMEYVKVKYVQDFDLSLGANILWKAMIYLVSLVDMIC